MMVRERDLQEVTGREGAVTEGLPATTQTLEMFFVTEEERQIVAGGYAGDSSGARHYGADDVAELLAFWVAGEEYALDIGQIQEIIKLPTITTVPRSPDFVLGIISLRGTIAPLLDLRTVLRLPTVDRQDDNRILVMRADGDLVGLLVDRVTSVVRLLKDEIEQVPRTMQKEGTEYIRGVGRIGERLLIVLDLASVVSVMG